MLHRVEGLETHPASEPGVISISVKGSNQIQFDVLSIPVLSQERATELIHEWQDSTSTRNRRNRLIATRHLSSQTRKLLRENDLSWAEERTGVCRLVAPGILVDVRVEGAEQKETAIRARLRDRSGLIAEILLLNLVHGEIRLANVAKQARVSTALASRVLTRLSTLKLVETNGAGPQRFWKILNAGGLLDLWATEEQSVPQGTGLYVWSRSPQELLKKMSQLNQLNCRWALAGTAAANLYAPTLTIFPDLSVWVESHFSLRQVAAVLGGEVVDKGANLQVLQSKSNLALENATLWTVNSGSSDLPQQKLRIISSPRAYIETVNAAGRAPEVAQNLRQRILSNGVS